MGLSWHGWATAAILLAVLLLSGCTAPQLAANGASLPPPSTLPVPQWHIGDQWHYVNSDGRWQNWTVEAREEHERYDSYKVVVFYSEPDVFGVTQTTYWIDTQTLGTIEQREGSQYARSEPPTSQIFPLINRTYEVSGEFSWGGGNEGKINSTVLGWDSVALPSTTWDAVEIRYIEEYTEKVFQHGWYSPEAGNYVRLLHADLYYDLVSWTWNE